MPSSGVAQTRLRENCARFRTAGHAGEALFEDRRRGSDSVRDVAEETFAIAMDIGRGWRATCENVHRRSVRAKLAAMAGATAAGRTQCSSSSSSSA